MTRPKKPTKPTSQHIAWEKTWLRHFSRDYRITSSSINGSREAPSFFSLGGEAPSLKGKRRYTHNTPVTVALDPTHVRSYTRLMQTEHALACLFTDTWDYTWRNRPCAKLPPRTARKSSPPPHAKIPPKSDSTALRPTSQ